MVATPFDGASSLLNNTDIFTKGMVITMEKENYTGGSEMYPELVLSPGAEEKTSLSQTNGVNDSLQVKERKLTAEEKIAVANIEEQIKSYRFRGCGWLWIRFSAKGC